MKDVREMADWLHTHKILKLEAKSRSKCGWGGKSRIGETKKKLIMHILASCDAFVHRLLPTEYLEEQPCVFLDSWQTSGFGSFWEACKGLAAIQNLSEPCWFGNRATNLFKVWLAQGFASVSISSARPASPQAQPFSRYFGTSISCQARAQEVQRRLKIKTWVRKTGDQRPIFERQMKVWVWFRSGIFYLDKFIRSWGSCRVNGGYILQRTQGFPNILYFL